MPVSANLKARILELYQSEVLATHLDHGCSESIIILGQLVHMNFNANTIMSLCESDDLMEIRQICKDHLDGQALLHELYRTLHEETLH